MIEHYTKNIEMFQSLVPSDAVIKSIGDMVANRRLVASFIENDGMPTVPSGWRNGDVFFDGMVNAACSGVEIY
jgi:hypothetical protein